MEVPVSPGKGRCSVRHRYGLETKRRAARWVEQPQAAPGSAAGRVEEPGAGALERLAPRAPGRCPGLVDRARVGAGKKSGTTAAVREDSKALHRELAEVKLSRPAAPPRSYGFMAA